MRWFVCCRVRWVLTSPQLRYVTAVVMQNKAQVVYVLPDSASAERRFLFSEALFRSVGYYPLFIPGKPNRGQMDAISRGECHIVFGTKALLDTEVNGVVYRSHCC